MCVCVCACVFCVCFVSECLHSVNLKNCDMNRKERQMRGLFLLAVSGALWLSATAAAFAQQYSGTEDIRIHRDE